MINLQVIWHFDTKRQLLDSFSKPYIPKGVYDSRNSCYLGKGKNVDFGCTEAILLFNRAFLLANICE